MCDGDAKKSYERFREICINICQALFTVPPSFAGVEYKFTDVQLRNHLAQKKSQQLEEASASWLEFLEDQKPRAKKPKQATTAKTTTAVVTELDQQLRQVDFQALLPEHQLAQQNLILEEQLTQQIDFQSNFDDLFSGLQVFMEVKNI